jgi:hypothetical protein
MTTQWITDIDAMFTEVNAKVKAIRVANSLPELSPDGDIIFGKERIPEEHDAPRIVIFPVGHDYEPARQSANVPTTGYEEGEVPLRVYHFTRVISFEAHIWGGPDPQFQDSPTSKLGSLTYDFNTTWELEREFLYALAATMTIPTGQPKAGEWRQDTDVNRRGRCLVVTFQVRTPIAGEEFTILDYSQTAGDGGVTREVTVTIGSTPTGPVVIPTPN